MKKKVYTIGRDESCDIIIPDKTDVTSRLHATIRIESNNKIFITDQSKNGTYINGIKMSSNVEIPITRGDVVSFAHIYNLDWNLIPKCTSKLLIFSIIGLIFLIAFGLVYFILNRQKVVPPVINSEEHQSEVISPVEKNIEKDTVVVRDTIIVKTKEKPTAPKRKKVVEEKKPEKEEIIYNPIY